MLTPSYQSITGIGGNMDISGYITVTWNFIDIKSIRKTFQVKGYYMTGIG